LTDLLLKTPSISGTTFANSEFMKKHFLYAGLIFFGSCTNVQSQNDIEISKEAGSKKVSKTENYYLTHVNDSVKSKCFGTLSNGTLKNATLLPFHSEHLSYFDQYSYLQGRGFMHSDVAEIIDESFKRIKTIYPERIFYLMECSAQNGGKLEPHRTHQNGMSVDLMSPKLKSGVASMELDTIGVEHYFLEFNNKGQYVKDTTIVLDFETIAQEIVEIDKVAREKGYKISKVIFKIELKKYLYETFIGKELAQRGIYFAQNLTPIINALHEDHFHIDFERVK